MKIARWMAGVLIIAAAVGCSRNQTETAAGEAAVLVNAGDVVRGETRRLETGVSFTGELVPIEIVAVTARIDGDLDAVHVREGERVRRGQPLAHYRPRDVTDRLQAAEAQLLAAAAGLRAAENATRRAQRLFDAGGAAASDLEAAQAQLAAAQAAYDGAAAVRNNAQEDSERLDVPSPIDGWVSAMQVHAGDHTGLGDPLCTLVDTSVLELSATVPSEALARVGPGTPIRVRLEAYPDEVFNGQIDRVNPTTEPGTRQVRIYARLPNPDGRLVGGLFAGGRVIDALKEEAIAAPLATLRKEGGAQVVYRLRGGRAERIPVTLGMVDDEAGFAELLGGVSAGDSLLTGVVPGLRDGVRVQVLAGAGDAAGIAETTR